MKLIEHDPGENKRGRSIWNIWTFWMIALPLIWAGFFAYHGPVPWKWVALGVLSGIVLSCWAIEITGNKVPGSWRRETPGSGGPRR